MYASVYSGAYALPTSQFSRELCLSVTAGSAYGFEPLFSHLKTRLVPVNDPL